MRNLRPNEKQAAIEMLGSSESSHSDGSSYTDASVSTCLPFNRLLRLLLNDERTRHKAAEKACRLLVRSKLTSRECNECIDELRYAARLPWEWKSRNAMLDNLLTLVSEWFDSAPQTRTDTDNININIPDAVLSALDVVPIVFNEMSLWRNDPNSKEFKDMAMSRVLTIAEHPGP